MNNIIKDNRIVSDITFATRFIGFLNSIRKYDLHLTSPILYEEFEYMCYVAAKLKKLQLDTVSTEHEVAYFKNLDNENNEKLYEFDKEFDNYLKKIIKTKNKIRKKKSNNEQ